MSSHRVGYLVRNKYYVNLQWLFKGFILHLVFNILDIRFKVLLDPKLKIILHASIKMLCTVIISLRVLYYNNLLQQYIKA